MQFVQNVPFFSIMLCMVSGIFSANAAGPRGQVGDGGACRGRSRR